MLELKNVTIKYNRQIILYSCNCKLPSQSIIVAKNNINTDIISRTFAGFHPVDGGEIHLDENVISEKKKLSKKSIFCYTGKLQQIMDELSFTRNTQIDE